MFNEYTSRRQKMVENQLLSRGIKDPRVIAAMRKVPRHLFLDEALWPEAYEDHPVPHRREADHFSTLYRCSHDRST